MLQWIRQETPGHQSIEVTAKQDIPDTFGSGIDGPFVLGKVTYRDTPAILAANGRRPSRLILEECMNRLGCQRSMNTTYNKGPLLGHMGNSGSGPLSYSSAGEQCIDTRTTARTCPQAA